MPRGCAIVSVLRALALLGAAYLGLSWLTVALYDPTPFATAYVARYLLFNLHTALAPLCLCLAAILGQARDFLLARAKPTTELIARARRLERRTLLGLTIACAASCTAVDHAQPVVLRDGIPALRASSRMGMDHFSTRPTIVVDTNAAGFRDGPWPSAPRAAGGPLRVLLLGDSVVFGSGIRAQGETLTPVLARQLRDSGLAAEVYNLALLGLNFRQEVDLAERHAPAIHPDLVVVLHNEENDLMPVLPYYAHPHLCALFPLGFITYVNALDRWMLDHRLSAAPAALDELDRSTERLTRLAERAGFDVLVVYLHGACPPHYYRPPAHPTRRFAYARLGDWHERPGLTFPNDFHPTPAGVGWMAERLAPLVRRMREPAPQGGGEPLTEQFERECVAQPAPGSSPERSGNAPAAPSPSGPDTAPATSGVPAATADPPSAPAPAAVAVLPAGLEPAVRALFDLGADDQVAGGFVVTSIAISAERIVVTLERGAERAELVLAHPDRTPSARWRSQSFAIRAERESALGGPAGSALGRLARAVVERDHGGFWVAPGGTPEAR